MSDTGHYQRPVNRPLADERFHTPDDEPRKSCACGANATYITTHGITACARHYVEHRQAA